MKVYQRDPKIAYFFKSLYIVDRPKIDDASISDCAHVNCRSPNCAFVCLQGEVLKKNLLPLARSEDLYFASVRKSETR